MYIACINVIPSFVKCQISYPLKEKKMTSILCVFIKSLEEDKKTDMHYTESQTKLHTFVFLFSVSMLIDLISHGDYLATGVYRTLMSG